VLAVPSALRVQVVVYDIDAPTVLRLGESVARAVNVARRDGALGAASLVIGDCSPEPTLSGDDLLALGARCEAALEGVRMHVGHRRHDRPAQRLRAIRSAIARHRANRAVSGNVNADVVDPTVGKQRVARE